MLMESGKGGGGGGGGGGDKVYISIKKMYV